MYVGRLSSRYRRVPRIQAVIYPPHSPHYGYGEPNPDHERPPGTHFSHSLTTYSFVRSFVHSFIRSDTEYYQFFD
jgi:hypothetical protein